MKKFFSLTAIAIMLLAFVSGCTKEGPMGPAGKDGVDGVAGKDANETCKQCHTPSVVEQKATEFEYSKHFFGEAFSGEGTQAGCAPCHSRQGFLDVIAKNTIPNYVWGTTSFSFSYNSSASALTTPGSIGCNTCHPKIHTTYGSADWFPLATTAEVTMAYQHKKKVNLAANSGESNLCLKCHQPRPMNSNATGTGKGYVLNYDSLTTLAQTAPTTILYDNTKTTNYINVTSFRTHNHYGTVGAMYAGMSAFEFKKPANSTSTYLDYTNGAHTTKASCQDCHMAAPTGAAGGHSFVAKGNFNGCNTTACHGATPVTTTNAKYWVNPRKKIQDLLVAIANKLVFDRGDGVKVSILNVDANAESNLWVNLTPAKYDGYLNVYDANSNPGGFWRNPANASYTNAGKVPSLSIVQFGAIINFQFALRDYSLGIHNPQYTEALLTNTLAALTDAGY